MFVWTQFRFFYVFGALWLNVLFALSTEPLRAASVIDEEPAFVVEQPISRAVLEMEKKRGPDITAEFVHAYRAKRTTLLTINQVSVEGCPEIETVVSILDDGGTPVAGLTRSDFEVFEDGVAIPFDVRPSSVNVGVGLSLAICIDRSSSLSNQDFANEKVAALALVALLDENDAAAIYAFAGRGAAVDLVQTFTTDKNVLAAAINGISLGGSTALYDAISRALVDTATRVGRKAVVVMTDGRDSSSSTSFNQVLAEAAAAGIPIFSIGFGNADGALLELLARDSGGAFFPSVGSNELQAILNQIGAILSQQYILSFRSSLPDGGQHRITIRVNLGGEVLEDERDYGNCNFVLDLPAPNFVKPANFWIDNNGNLVCLFPYPNRDGIDRDGLADLIYWVSLMVNCQNLLGPFPVALEGGQDRWPKILKIPADMLPTAAYQISVARADASIAGGEPGESLFINGPSSPSAAGVPSSYRGFNRWLLHIPSRSGGFSATIKIANRHTQEAVSVALAGFDRDGGLLKLETIQVPADQVGYFAIYGNGSESLFPGFQDQISHIGIFETSNLSRIWLRYQSEVSGYGAWIEETELSEGTTIGSSLEMEARSAAPYVDGLAILNLSSVTSSRVWVTHRERDGSLIAERDLGLLEPGAKSLVILSDLFPFQNDTRYHVETRDTRQNLQAVGLSFFGGDFFNTVPIRALPNL